MDWGHEPAGAGGEAEPPWFGEVVCGGGWGAACEVGEEHLFGGGDGGGFCEEKGDFEVEAEAAVVEVGGADACDVVDEDGFFVEEAGVVAVGADAGFFECW